MGYNFKTFNSDKCALICEKDGQKMLVTLFVDDLRFYFSCVKQYQQLYDYLSEEFILSDRSNSGIYLGMNVTRNNNHGYHLSCRKLIDKLEVKYSLENMVIKDTPMIERKYSTKDLVKLKDKDGKETKIYKEFRSIVGAIGYMYVACRPDIGYACNRLQRQVVSPHYGHWKDLMHLVAYLRSTRDEGIDINGDWDENDNMLHGFTDSSYGDCEDKASSYGYIIYMGSDIIMYKASKSTTIMRSSCEAELYAVDSCLRELVPLIRILKDFDIEVKCLPFIHCDNSAAIKIIESDKNIHGVKHTEIEIAYLRNLERRQIYGMVKIHTNNNCADILTKSLFIDKYKDMKLKLYNPNVMHQAETLRLSYGQIPKDLRK